MGNGKAVSQLDAAYREGVANRQQISLGMLAILAKTTVNLYSIKIAANIHNHVLRISIKH